MVQKVASSICFSYFHLWLRWAFKLWSVHFLILQIALYLWIKLTGSWKLDNIIQYIFFFGIASLKVFFKFVINRTPSYHRFLTLPFFVVPFFNLKKQICKLTALKHGNLVKNENYILLECSSKLFFSVLAHPFVLQSLIYQIKLFGS